MDHRSAYINREIGVMITGREQRTLTSDMLAQIALIQGSSTLVAKEGQEVVSTNQVFRAMEEIPGSFDQKRDSVDMYKKIIKHWDWLKKQI